MGVRGCRADITRARDADGRQAAGTDQLALLRAPGYARPVAYPERYESGSSMRNAERKHVAGSRTSPQDERICAHCKLEVKLVVNLPNSMTFTDDGRG